MSKEHEQQRDTHHRERGGSGPDLDAEHDADTSRRASNAQLRAAQRRVAEGPPAAKKADKPKASQAELHEAAEQAAYEAMFANVDLLAKRMHQSADNIEGVINWKGDEGGPDKKIEMIKAEFKSIKSQLIKLRFEAATVQVGGRPIGRDLQILYGGLRVFEQAMGRATSLAGNDAFGSEYDIRWVKDELQMLAQHFGHDLKNLQPIAEDERIDGDTDLEAQAIHASVASIEASVQAVAAGLGAAASPHLDADVGSLIAAVGETKTFLETIAPNRIGKSKKLQQALADLEPVERALAGDRRFTQRLANAGFSFQVSYLRNWVKQHK